MIKENIRSLIKEAIKDTFSEKINKIVKYEQDTYLIYTDSTILLALYDSIIGGMNEHFRFFNSYHFGDRCVVIYRDLIKKFIKKFEILKKKKPIKASIMFIGNNNEVYFVSPSFILDFKEKFGTIGKSEEGDIIIFVPTVLLPKWKNQEINLEELRARRMIQIIEDINSIPIEEVSIYDDKDESNISLIPELYLDTSNDEKNEYFLKKLNELEREIKKLKEARRLKRKRKNGN